MLRVVWWLIPLLLAAAPVKGIVRTTIPFDSDWRFLKADAPGAEKPEFADAQWRALNVPHDWSIEGPFDQKNPAGGAVGAAVPLRVWERRLEQLKRLGVNAIRTAHNPPAPEFLDLWDRMGLLVMDEMFNCWTVAKNPYDYHLYFRDWSLTDTRDTVLRDRNHPSIVVYSAGNEIRDTPNAELAIGILQGLVDAFHKAGPTRPVSQALFRPNASHEPFQASERHAFQSQCPAIVKASAGTGRIAVTASSPSPAAATVDIETGEFRVGNYGAKGDGKTVDTAAIQKAIDAAAAAKAGAGTVVFAPGVYLSGSLFLKSGTELRLDAGVEIRGVQDLAAYPIIETRVAGIEMKWPAALINVYEQSHVKISGKGVIDGDGKIWWDKYWALRKEYEPKGLRWAADYDCQRPRLIQIYKSSDVDLVGLELRRSGFWTVHICYSQRVHVDGTTIRNNIGGRGPSTDGIDIDSSSGVLVEHCDLDCNDDDICLKAGRDADGLRVNRPSEKIVIRDCTVRGGAAGITIGSETSGGIRDVEAYRIHVLRPVPAGILFKSASTRGGTIENIVIHDIDMQGVATPISITLNWNPSYSYAKMPEGIKNPPDYWRVLTEAVPPEKGLPHFRNVKISAIKAVDAQRAFSVSSYKDSPLENFEFKNLEIDAKSAGGIEYADHWTFVNTHIKTADGSVVMLKDCRSVTGM